MIPPPLETIAQELRNAAGHRAYALTGEMIVGLCGTAAECVKALPPEDPQALEIVVYVNELLEWTEVMLRSARASHADELRRVPFLKGYLQQAQLSSL